MRVHVLHLQDHYDESSTFKALPNYFPLHHDSPFKFVFFYFLLRLLSKLVTAAFGDTALRAPRVVELQC